MPVQIPRRSPWTDQRLVLWALLHRETVTRFGKYKMGVLWMLVEPLISVIVIGLLLGPIVGRTSPDMPYAFFLLNGFVLLKTFVGPAMAGVGAISANSGLLVFPKVRPLDILLARFLFELITSVFSFTVFCLVGLWMGIQLSLGHLHVLLATFIITWLLGSGAGLMISVEPLTFNPLKKSSTSSNAPSSSYHAFYIHSIIYQISHKKSFSTIHWSTPSSLAGKACFLSITSAKSTCSTPPQPPSSYSQLAFACSTTIATS